MKWFSVGVFPLYFRYYIMKLVSLSSRTVCNKFWLVQPSSNILLSITCFCRHGYRQKNAKWNIQYMDSSFVELYIWIIWDSFQFKKNEKFLCKIFKANRHYWSTISKWWSDIHDVSPGRSWSFLFLNLSTTHQSLFILFILTLNSKVKHLQLQKCGPSILRTTFLSLSITS